MAARRRRVSRRGFLKATGATVAGAGLGAAALDRGLAASPPGPSLPPAATPPSDQLDSWVRIGPDGRVHFSTGRVELGQGNTTALAQLVAEELDVPFERVEMVMGDTATSIDQGETSGSTSIRNAGVQIPRSPPTPARPCSAWRPPSWAWPPPPWW